MSSDYFYFMTMGNQSICQVIRPKGATIFWGVEILMNYQNSHPLNYLKCQSICQENSSFYLVITEIYWLNNLE